MALRALLRTRGVAWAPIAQSAAATASVSHGGRRGSKNLDWYFNAVAKAEEDKTAVKPLVYPAESVTGQKRTRAFMDFQFGKDSADVPPAVSRVVFELADDIVPLTVKNFLELCARPAGSGYKGSEFFMVRKNFGIMGGDWVSKNGRGGHSAFPTKNFIDENFIVRHAAPGVLTMANSGVHSNNSVFMVTLAALPHLDGRNVAFGKVLTGMDTIQKIGSAFTVNLAPATPVIIKDAGVLPVAEWAAVDKAVAAAVAAASKTAAKPEAAPAKAKSA